MLCLLCQQSQYAASDSGRYGSKAEDSSNSQDEAASVGGKGKDLCSGAAQAATHYLAQKTKANGAMRSVTVDH